MLFKLHYLLMTAGVTSVGLLLGVYIQTYTDATTLELGTLYMLRPFITTFFRPIICSFADINEAHQNSLIWCLIISTIGYSPFIIIPFLGPQVYVDHARICWYVLLVVKVVGDIAFGGVRSIGDALTINYARRIGVNYGVYRIWGSISLIVFGLIIGSVNEIWFMPKFVPAFIILILSSFLDMLVIWLWPKEYFKMVTPEHDNKIKSSTSGIKEKNKLTKSLMPKEAVWAHAKGKLSRLLSCGCFKKFDKEPVNMSLLSTITTTINSSGIVEMVEKSNSQNRSIMVKEKTNKISVRLQLRMLFMLLYKDPRLALYLIFFIVTGLGLAPLDYFFVSLSEICQEKGTCNFSRLAGFIIPSMAVIQAILFIYVKRIEAIIGRVNICGIAMFLISVKYLFYGTIWRNVNPYFAILSGCLHGFGMGVFTTFTVELAHLFANEVVYILPELIRKGVINSDAEVERLNLSLAATMQSLFTSAQDGIGRGFGALFYGYLLEKYTYETLWLIVGIGALIMSSITLSIGLIDSCFELNIGLDKKAMERSSNNNNNSSTINLDNSCIDVTSNDKRHSVKV